MGKYGYVDPNGELRVVEYRALGDNHFEATGAVGPDAQALQYHQAQVAEHQRLQQDFLRDWQRLAGRAAPVPAAPAPPPSAWSPRISRPLAPRQRTQPAQAAFSWEDAQGGRASVWTMDSARLSPISPAQPNYNAWNSQFNKRNGISPSAQSDASSSFSWPETESEAMAAGSGFGFRIKHT